MATQEGVISLSFAAAADYSADIYTFVKIVSGVATQCSSAGEDADGVLMNNPAAAGDEAQVAIFGKVRITLGGTVADDAYVQTHTDGTAITAAASDYNLGKVVIGGVAGDVVDMILGSRNIEV